MCTYGLVDGGYRSVTMEGSSTDLAPSVIGYYDSLTNNNQTINNINSGHIISTTSTLQQRQSDEDISLHNTATTTTTTCTIDTVQIKKSLNVNGTQPPLCKNNSTLHNKFAASVNVTTPAKSAATQDCSNSIESTIHQQHQQAAKSRNNISFLSASVQRMIAHSETAVDNFHRSAAANTSSHLISPPSNGNSNTNNNNNNINGNKCKLKLATNKLHKHAQISIPLSRNTCKLTQTGTELVETIERSNSGGDSDNSARSNSCESLDNQRTPTNGSVNSSNDDEKTPTNGDYNQSASRFRYDHHILKEHHHQSNRFDSHQQFDVQFNHITNHKNNNNNNNNHHTNHTLSIIEENRVNNIESLAQTLQYVDDSSSTETSLTVKEQLTNKSELSDLSDDNCDDYALTDANNYCVKLAPKLKEQQHFSSLSISEASDRGPALSVTVAAATNETNNSTNTMSTEDVAKVTQKPPSSPHMTYSRSKLMANRPLPQSPQSPRKSGKVTVIGSPIASPKPVRNSDKGVPEIIRLKNRPLSALSTSSTSSSSSSGSEHIASKLGVSYLASVESLADQSENEMGSSNLTVRERSCLEIIDSERSYVDDLGQVIRGYLKDWKESACLKDDELNILFSNIQEIYEFNAVLLKQLINSGSDPLKIAKCFIELKHRFEVYTIYCTSYPEAISLLTSLLQASHTNALLTSTQKMLRHNLPLGSYLLKPVQRILKYHLLLDNLRKHSDHVPEVSEAHELMKEVAHHIDQVKRHLEQLSRVKELSGILDGWLGPELTVLGELKKEGLLMESNKARIVFLFQTMLIITKQKEDSRLQFKSYIHCKNLMLVEHLPGEPTSFNVIPYDDPRNHIKLTAKNRDQKRLWAQQIKQVMLEHFDIPSRAKELVFKLGDEEDRTPDKNTWKWGTGTSSTPEYLQRRHQYRNSEMRYRSKNKRKNLSTSLSMEGIENKSDKLNKSLDDSILASSHANSQESLNNKMKCNHQHENCGCKTVKTELTNTLSRKKEEQRNRSKSESRINDAFPLKVVKADDIFKRQRTDSLYKFSTLGRPKSKTIEVKMYNAKTLPKRIATLKKNRAKSVKETSKFYMDLDTTVLRITESTDNLAPESPEPVETKKEIKEKKKTESKSTIHKKENDVDGDDGKLDEHPKKDFEIISELLKEHKEFDKILKKPPKKKSVNYSRSSSHEVLHTSASELNTLPDKSASGETKKFILEEQAFKNQSEKLMLRLKDIETDLKSPEPIYESLLRNVHVPYKFSPVLSRSKSHQGTPATKLTPRKADRPESDYVTLIYNENGELKGVDNTIVSIKGEMMLLRNSDSNINYNKMESSQTTYEDVSASGDDLERRGSLGVKPTRNLLQRFIHHGKDDSMSSSETSLSKKSQERGGSDHKKEVSRKSIIYKQGSESLGCRIAHVDYADPRTLFNVSMENVLINKNAMVNMQRDSVFSLTSSSDSVCETKNTSVINSDSLKRFNDEDSYYEKSVEASLEDDCFRDSAIYSDDNERRVDCVEDRIYDKIERPPPPLPKKQPPKTPMKPVKTPPIPVKTTLSFPVKKSDSGDLNEEALVNGNAQGNKRECSWVLQQIHNFNK